MATVTQRELIEELNRDLERELRSIVQYVQHTATVKGARYRSIIDELGVHLQQELDPALTLARQIDLLGGTPSTVVPPVEAETGSEEALQQDLELETQQLARHRARVAQAGALGPADVAETLTPLLEQTQEHVRDLQATLQR